MALKIKENYLKTIFANADEEGKITLSLLSMKMGISIPTVNSMAKSLHDLGWIRYEKYKPLQLTPEGKKVAAMVLRKHRITEIFLVEKLGIGWEHVHEIAEEMEHINSELLFDRMNEMLGNPTNDPHGSPIPNKDGFVQTTQHIPLSSLMPGQKAKLYSIHNSTHDFLIFLNKKGISLGMEFNILEKEPFDQSMRVNYSGHETEILSYNVCERLYVEIT
jgi:DtxR family Mn-dependent transcriptional regulator